MFPITQFLPQVLESLSHYNNLVLQAEPGAGKSTALPLSLIDAEWLGDKTIVMLEPRRVAAKSIAHYLAKQLGEKVGGRVGYQVKNDRKISKGTKLEIVTEGILTRRLQSDPELSDVGLIIFDEMHERSIHADLALMLALEVQQTIREDLKLLVMSATIDTDLISAYMDNAAVIKCPGRAYPVSVEYSQKDTIRSHASNLSSAVASALESVLSPDKCGDTLVFLPGQADIKRCLSEAVNMFRDQPGLVFLPLYGGLSIDQQERALVPDPSGKRRIIFTTNIAETSLTIEGVTAVIDSGLEKVLIYDPASGMTRLDTHYISKASAEQRKGRAGRIQAGACIRLWSEAKYHSLKDYQGEEILSADLANLVLDLCQWGLTDYHSINWLTPPPIAHFDTAKDLLVSIGLLTDKGKATPLGEKASKLGLHPRLAAMLLQAKSPIEQAIACELAAYISEGDIFYNRRGVDIIERLIAIQDYKADKKSAMQSWPLKAAIVEQALTASRSLKNIIKASTKPTFFSLIELQEHVGKLLLIAYPDRLAKRRSDNCGRYQMANGRGAMLFDDDPLFGADWLVISDCNGQKKEGHIYAAAALALDDIHESIGHLLVEESVYQLDDKKQNIVGRKLSRYRALTLSTKPLANIPPEAFHACLNTLLQSEGLKLLNWTPKCECWLARAIWLGEVLESFPKISQSLLFETIDEWLLPYISDVKSLAQLKKVNIYELLVGILSWEQQQLLEQEAPLVYVTPSDKKVPIVYDKNQGPTVSVRLQEMFGELESPKIGGNNVPLRFELLSPAQRPIQTTSDLANFWNTSYFDVAKEMRGRYPRHRWPEQPLLEKPGHSIKHRRR
ncbi:ATP-dependent helicase HrpB [Alkalimarinus sediminis]|uniref:ATP-dependent helicase HrpB n=1 Tax=Alkalimarinus sediminis TaxID=1632866 RepID=A0A9E8HF47_9ALTE|nr:ATP-dependent helicase HrpB [Alkalimarinus sediminis]UZW73299.1 ATP-dependent helicase HrpB [Alkalimarinus sediminis]